MQSERTENEGLPDLPFVVKRSSSQFVVISVIFLFSISVLLWLSLVLNQNRTKGFEIVFLMFAAIILVMSFVLYRIFYNFLYGSIAAIATKDGLQLFSFFRNKQRFYQWREIRSVELLSLDVFLPLSPAYVSITAAGKMIGKGLAFFSILKITVIIFLISKLLQKLVFDPISKKFGLSMNEGSIFITATLEYKNEYGAFTKEKYEHFFVKTAESQKIVDAINLLRQQYS